MDNSNNEDLVKVNILFFAKSRELVGETRSEVSIPSTAITSDKLISFLLQTFPRLQPLKGSMVLALNEEYISLEDSFCLSNGDDIAVIPPLSGVSEMATDIVELSENRLNIEDISNSVILPNCGAVSMFIGTTRNHCDGKQVLNLQYEAYHTMAKKKMAEICEDIRKKWGIGRITMVHRLGEVPVTEASVVIAISSEHRKESLEAVQYAIDTLKAVVPIWKKELYVDHSPHWKQNAECLWKKTES